MADTAVVEQPQAPVAPTAEPAAPVAPPEPSTVAEHEKRYGPNGTGEQQNDDGSEESGERDRKGRFRPKSKKDYASPEDVPRIRELSRKIHEKDETIAQFQRRIEALEGKGQSAPSPIVRTIPPVASVDFNEPEPTLEQFAEKDDPYGAWQRALAAYDRRKEAAELQARHMQAHQQHAAQQVQQYYQQAETAHQQRLVAAIANDPQAYQALASAKAQGPLPPLLDWAVMLDNESHTVALYLATHPGTLDEFVLMTDAKPVTEQTVATTQRLLRQRMSTVTTGAVTPPPPLPTAPRPPTPVRTGSIRTADDPPGDDASLAAHELYYGKGKRR